MVNRYLSELSHKIEERKLQLNHLESQRNEAKTSAMKDSKTLERQKLGLMRRLEEVNYFLFFVVIGETRRNGVPIKKNQLKIQNTFQGLYNICKIYFHNSI